MNIKNICIYLIFYKLKNESYFILIEQNTTIFLSEKLVLQNLKNKYVSK